MISPNPFTPQSGWEPKVFAGREKEFSIFRENLKDALISRPNHLIVLGEWGTGKTSLLKQFRRISQEAGYAACFCAISRFTERDRPVDIIYFLAEEMIMGFPKIGIQRETLRDLFMERKRPSNAQVQFTLFLLNLWKALDTDLVVVFFDDVQNLLPVSNIIDIIRAVLSEDDIIKNTRYMFVLSSTPSGWASFIDRHDPVGRFFRKRLNVENLSASEVRRTVEMTLKGTGVTFEEPIKEMVFEYTGGHPYEVQLLSSHLYEGQIEGVVRKEAWDSALSNTLRELGRDYFEYLLSKASDREMDLLKILAQERRPLSIKDFTNMMIIGKYAKRFPIANIKNFLYRLEKKELVKRLPDGNFDILDIMFREFICRMGL